MFNNNVSEFYHFTGEVTKYKDKSLIPGNINKLLKKQKRLKLNILVIHEVFSMTINQFTKMIHDHISELIEITVRAPYVEIEDKR